MDKPFDALSRFVYAIREAEKSSSLSGGEIIFGSTMIDGAKVLHRLANETNKYFDAVSEHVTDDDGTDEPDQLSKIADSNDAGFLWCYACKSYHHPDNPTCQLRGPAGDYIRQLLTALKSISLLGGNLPDEHLTDRTGPNDAAHRGLMYCQARQIANQFDFAELETKA